MQVGKLPGDKLRALVLGRLGTRRSDVLLGAGIGLDAAVIDFGGEVCVASADPITGATADVGHLAVHVACNDVAAHGARPIGVVCVILLPAGTGDDRLDQVAGGIDRATRELGIQVLGGHTEITSRVTEAVVVVTALGRAAKDRCVSAAEARPGDTLVLSKGAGIEGTAILGREFRSELEPAIGRNMVAEAASLAGAISVVPEALIAVEAGCAAMHDVTEGGVLGALAEMGEAAGVGCELREEAVPVLPSTAAICRHLGLDPLGLLSSGSLLIATADGDALVGRLAEAGIAAAVIGKVTAGEPRIRRRDGRWEHLSPYPQDELWRFLAEREGKS